MKPRMLQLVTLSEWGGAQHIVYLLAKHFKQEYDITVACAPGGPLIERARAEGLRVIEIPNLCRPPHPWRDPCAFWQIYRLIKRERFDIVHAHSTKAGLLGRLAARLAGVPVILFTAHGWAFTEGRRYWIRWWLAQIERFASLASTKIVCVSEYDRQLALRFGVASQEKLVVIPNGLEIEPFCSLIDKKEFRYRLGASNAAGIVTMVGRLAPPKDLKTLMAAWEGLKTSGWSLWIVGEGPLRSRLERLIQAQGLGDHIMLLGERHDIPELLKASDILVLASRWEGMPLTIIEAMFAGLPAVATRVGGVPELVEDGVTGLLVPPKDAFALRDALERLMGSEETRQRMGELGRRRALERFTAEQMISRMEDLYHDLELQKGLG